jgi:hypothetical protein
MFRTPTKGIKVMNKILIGIGVVLSAYLIYSSINNEEDITTVASETVSDNQEITKVDNQENTNETPVPEEVYDNNSTTIDGRYILNITTDTTKTSQVFTFSSNGTFELTRSMISPNPALGGSVEGSYKVTGNTIDLIFSVERDKETFPVDTGIMTIKSESELEYGGHIAVLDYTR